jgi:hypothetical protein
MPRRSRTSCAATSEEHDDTVITPRRINAHASVQQDPGVERPEAARGEILGDRSVPASAEEDERDAYETEACPTATNEVAETPSSAGVRRPTPTATAKAASPERNH